MKEWPANAPFISSQQQCWQKNEKETTRIHYLSLKLMHTKHVFSSQVGRRSNKWQSKVLISTTTLLDSAVLLFARLTISSESSEKKTHKKRECLSLDAIKTSPTTKSGEKKQKMFMATLKTLQQSKLEENCVAIRRHDAKVTDNLKTVRRHGREWFHSDWKDEEILSICLSWMSSLREKRKRRQCWLDCFLLTKLDHLDLDTSAATTNI